MRYTPWIVSEHVPDFSSLARLVSGPGLAGKKGQDLAIALWGLMVDAELGIFHYFPAQESLWGKDVVDPMKIFNVYGFSICHCHAHCLAMLFRSASLPARIATITGHEGTEAFYDGAWHYFDADIQMFYRLRPPRQDVVASREDLYRDPSLVADQPHASPPHHMPDRLPANMRKSYESPPEYPDLLEEQAHSMDFRLRPGEQLVRYFHNRGRWVAFNTYPECFQRYPSETGPEGPTERFWPRRQWGNGYFLYQPDLTDKSRDIELGADELSGLAPMAAGLTCQGAAGHVVLAFESPYIYCGVPDPYRRAPAVDGATLTAQFNLPAGSKARIEWATEQSADWQTLREIAGQAGPVKCKLDFTEQAEGRYRLRLQIVLEGAGASLNELKTQLWFMVSPHSLPALKNVGANRMSLHSGDEHGLPTRPTIIETRMDRPDALVGAHKTVNLRHDPSTYSLLLPTDPARPWELIYQLSAPAGGTMAWVRAYTLIEARRPEEKPDGVPAKIDIADSPDGPWRTIAQRDIQEHPQGWHFGMFGQGRFAAAGQNGYIRFSATKGIKGVRIMGHYVPAGAESAGAQTKQSPLEIEHSWYEVEPQVGRRLHTHVEKVTTPDHQYVVNCRHQPHDERIVLRVPSTVR